MIKVDRLVKEERETSEERIVPSLEPLSAFREKAAWVLLGEPGAGKSTSLEQEAEACNEACHYLSIAEFIYEYSEDELRGKTLFLDGLDEIRASSKDGTILLQVKARLRKLDNPKFRLACRAADWLGTSDSDDIKLASQDNKIARLLLAPLSAEEILSILRENHSVADPGRFVKKAESLGVDHLLENPQTLEMLFKAVRGDQWPKSRLDTFQLACEQLTEEPNRHHRDQKRSSAIDKAQLLDAAGQLFAVMLLADKEGVALDQDKATPRSPCLDDYLPSARDVAYEVVHRNLFRLKREECVKPAHRSIAEYLSATWLAKQIDTKGLPLGRVLNLLIGTDGRAVSGLHGLYGWLAIQCETARTRLIQADALTVVVYGDAKLLPETDKRSILQGLQKEAEERTSFHRDVEPATPFAALADPALLDDFATALTSTSRDSATQSYVDCLLSILNEGAPIPQLENQLLAIVKDDSWENFVRNDALRNWLKIQGSPGKAQALLDEISHERTSDFDDELTAKLLRYLYPAHLTANKLFDYFHPPKSGHLMSRYVWFWQHEFAQEGADDHLTTALEQLINDPEKLAIARKNFHLKRMISRLVARCIVAHGDSATDKELFEWLLLGSGKYHDSTLEAEDREVINGWLADHPDRYKGLLRHYIERNSSKQNIHTYEFRSLIQGAVVPDDFGIWCLEQASSAKNNETIVKAYLSEVLDALINQQGDLDLTLEKVERWATENKSRQEWLMPYLFCEVEGWRKKQAESKREGKEKHNIQRKERTQQIVQQMPAIRSGTANTQLMSQLAGVWWNQYTNSHGESLQARFDDFSENGSELFEAAKLGFIASPERNDLPTVSDIIDLSIKNREHYIRRPCLVGMEIRWELGVPDIDSLTDEALKQMVAFRLTYSYKKTPEWFTHLIKTRPQLVAEVYIQYAAVSLKARKSHIDSLSAIGNDSDFKVLAQRVVPALLKTFPLRAKSEQLGCLGHLLKSALRYQMESLSLIVKEKLAKKSLQVSQKVYWLAAGMLIDQSQYESALWGVVGDSQSRLNYLVNFLNYCDSEPAPEFTLSAHTTGKLIEQLAPHAELDWSRGDGCVTPAMVRGDHVRALISRLMSMATAQAEDEITRLLKCPTMEKLKFPLENARHQIRQKRREASFSFLSLDKVACILANQEPANNADLTELVLSYLDDIANEIRHKNDDGFSKFWNTDKDRGPKNKRVENACRDELLFRFREKLKPFKIDCQPESDYANDKRADMRISYRNEFELPVEIKRDDNRRLWKAARLQLAQQYSISPQANGYGLYLVLWFGKGDIAKAEDGGKKPQTPEELQHRLEALLNTDERNYIHIRVLDVSWPERTNDNDNTQ